MTITAKTAFFFSNTVLLLAIVVVNGFLFYFWPFWHQHELVKQDNYAFYMVWVALPFILMLVANFFIIGSVNALMFMGYSGLFFLAITSINYFYYMGILSDGSSGLIFTVLPFMELFGALVAIVVATILNQVKGRG